MALIIWYQVEFPDLGPGGLKVSNDVTSGASYILDADIKVNMHSGAVVDDFRMMLKNLPAEIADILKSKQVEAIANEEPLKVKIFLGYFEDSPVLGEPPLVIEGVITRLTNSVTNDGLLQTLVEGMEVGGYNLKQEPSPLHSMNDKTPADIVKDIAEKAGLEVKQNILSIKPLTNFTLVKKNALEALRQISKHTDPPSPLVVRDNAIFIGPLVGTEILDTILSPASNIVSMDERQFIENVETRTSFNLTVLGDASLKVGKTVFLEKDGIPLGPLRIDHVTTRFSTNQGYTNDVTLVVAEPGQEVNARSGAQGVVDRFRDMVNVTQDEQRAIDVGEISNYHAGSEEKHLATLNYKQEVVPDVVSPSVEMPITDETQLHSKPIASPFAWNKCGLVVPIYPGMRAVLNHNRGYVNDAIVSGFLWSENPRYQPPKNEAGDYWLCLPTEVNSEGPIGKGVNDLTDAAGRRVIQSKGLHVLVADDALPNVGDRPSIPDSADNVIVIEHESGTKIYIASDGELQVVTDSKDISLTNGQVSMKLTGGTVEVS